MTNLLTLPEWTWDKLCAAHIVVRSIFPETQMEDLFGLFPKGLRICFADEDQLPADVVDVDVHRDYKASGHESATQKAAADYGITDNDLPGIGHLCRILADNNGVGRKGYGGYLKDEERFPKSLVGLIRLVYRLPHNSDRHTFRLELVSEFWRVVDAYFCAAEVNIEAITALENPFTLDGYGKMLSIAGRDDSAVIAAKAVFENLFEKVASREESATARAEKIEATSFKISTIAGHQVFAHLIETDDARVAGKYLKEHQEIILLVVRRRTAPKRYVIFCRGQQNFAPLYAALEIQEPGKWFLDERPQSPQLLNGSVSRTAEASFLKPSEIIALIQERYKHTPRNHQ